MHYLIFFLKIINQSFLFYIYTNIILSYFNFQIIELTKYIKYVNMFCILYILLCFSKTYKNFFFILFSLIIGLFLFKLLFFEILFYAFIIYFIFYFYNLDFLHFLIGVTIIILLYFPSFFYNFNIIINICNYFIFNNTELLVCDFFILFGKKELILKNFFYNNFDYVFFKYFIEILTSNFCNYKNNLLIIYNINDLLYLKQNLILYFYFIFLIFFGLYFINFLFHIFKKRLTYYIFFKSTKRIK